MLGNPTTNLIPHIPLRAFFLAFFPTTHFSLPAGRISCGKARGGQVSKVMLLPSGLCSLLIWGGGEGCGKIGQTTDNCVAC